MSEQKKIKIALFTDVLRENLDGVTYTLYNIIERVPKERFEFLFITPYPPSEEVTLPFPVLVCRFIKFPLYSAYPLAIPFFDRKLKRELDSFKPDIIHFTTPAFLGYYAVKYARENRIPLVATYHTHFITYVEYYFRKLPPVKIFFQGVVRRITRWFYSRSYMTFVPTLPVKEDLVNLGIDEAKLMIWGRGISMDMYNPKFRDEEYIKEFAGSGLKILFVSRLVWEKELETLINVYKHFEKREDVKFIVTGEGPVKGHLMKKMPGALFTGKLIDKDLARIYASSDIFLFPSVTETFGNVVLEAMGSGLAVVVAARGGPRGIVKDGVTGLHAEPKNASDFCKKIERLLADTECRNRLRKNAYEYAKTQTWDSLCALLFVSYEDIVSEHGFTRN